MATTTTYAYWVGIYSPEGGGIWEIDSYVCCREYPLESLLYPGWYEDDPLSGQFTLICGPVIRTAGMLDADFDVLMQPCKDAAPLYPPGYGPSEEPEESSSYGESSGYEFEEELSSSESSGYDD